MLIKIPRGWEIPECEATPEEMYLNRRQFIKRLGLAGVGAATTLSGWNLVTAAVLNVNPQVPHPRWSQATEQPIPAGRPCCTTATSSTWRNYIKRKIF